MKLALIGYGAMGELVSKLAAKDGHEVHLRFTSRATDRDIAQRVKELGASDVAIDFSVAAAVPKNVDLCARAGVPLVEGTTGWNANLSEVRRTVLEHNSALIYGANFSIGVQLFYRIAAHAAKLFQGMDSYDSFIEEAHHKRKRDAPSGTALQLRQIVTNEMGGEIPIMSTRAGYIPGSHRLGFDSAADQITLTHTARSREGFAAGALLAANWIVGRKGIYEFSAVFEEILRSSH